MEELAARPVGPFKGVRSEEVALRLNQVGRRPGGAQRVKIAERTRGPRRRDAGLRRQHGGPPPAGLSLRQFPAEEGIEKQILQGGIPVERLFDFLQKYGADDAAAPPEQRDRTVIQLPAEGRLRRPEQGEPLGVGADFGGVERLFQCGDRGISPAQLQVGVEAAL